MLACGGIVLHGGASESWIGNAESYHTTNTFLKGLVSRAEASLGKGTLAVDVAEEVVAELEDYPAFNAGKGAAVNVDGNFEVEAGIVNGATSAYRAAVCLHETKNPIKLARAMLENSGPTTPVFIAGSGGDELAKQLGLEIVPNSYFATESRTSYWHKKKAEMSEHGTVGAVVLDVHGNLAAANSTGGMMFKPVGRVGDTAVLGSGLYADKNVAIACSGGGEAILASMLAGRIANLYSNGITIAKAVEQAMRDASQLFPTISCGVIAITADGQQTAQCNSRIFNIGSSGSKSGSSHVGLLPCTMPIITPLCFYEDELMRVGVSRHPTRLNQLTFQLKQDLSLVNMSEEQVYALFGKLKRICQSLVQSTGASDVAMVSWAGCTGGHLFPIGEDGEPKREFESETDRTEDYQTVFGDGFMAIRQRVATGTTNGGDVADASLLLLGDAEIRWAVELFQRALEKDASLRMGLHSGGWSLFAGRQLAPLSLSAPSSSAPSSSYCYRDVLVASSYIDPYWPSPAPFQHPTSYRNNSNESLPFTAALGPRSLDMAALLRLADKLRDCFIRLHWPTDYIPVMCDSVSGRNHPFCYCAFLGTSDTGEMYLRTGSIRLDGNGLGSVAGGAIVERFGWRWLYMIQVPFCIITLIMVYFFVPSNTENMSAEETNFPLDLRQLLHTFDWKGALFLVLVLGLLMFVLGAAGNILPWTNPFILLASALFPFMVCLLARAEVDAAKPILPPILAGFPFRNIMMNAFLLSMINYIIMYNATFFFQSVLVESATLASTHLVVPSIAFTLISAISGTAIARLETPKPTLQLSQFLLLGGAACLLLMPTLLPSLQTPGVVYSLCLAMPILGVGMMAPSALLLLLGMSNRENHATMNGGFIMMRSLGGFTATSVSTTVVQNIFQRTMRPYMVNVEAREKINLARLNIDSLRTLEEPLRGQGKVSHHGDQIQ
ncbi:putative L-asparaginase [Trichoderma sp. SZMC 28012]